jgi:large subunit ribosomal protein L5
MVEKTDMEQGEDIPQAQKSKTPSKKQPAKRRATAKAASVKKAKAEEKTSKKTPRRRKTSTAVEQIDSPTAEAPQAVVPRMLDRLRSEIAPKMIEEFGYSSSMQAPKLQKIVLNIGMGESLDNSRAMENAIRDLTLITGQRPVTTRARKSIAGFKIREGMIVGVSVTLRGRRMYEFIDRLLSSALPRIRDFRGLSRKAFDGRGNYSLGIREQVIFPEIDYNTIDKMRGLQVVIQTTARTDSEGFRLLELMGMPFAKSENLAGVA